MARNSDVDSGMVVAICTPHLQVVQVLRIADDSHSSARDVDRRELCVEAPGTDHVVVVVGDNTVDKAIVLVGASSERVDGVDLDPSSDYSVADIDDRVVELHLIVERSFERDSLERVVSVDRRQYQFLEDIPG